MFAPIAVALAMGLIGLAYQALKPPPPSKLCGSPGGPPVTSPRIKLSDGRHVAYRETGVPKEEANHKIIIIHGFGSSKDLNLPVSQELIEELKIYFVSFDRPGYGESDPHPLRTVKTEACDVEQLADKLQIGSKFYVIGISMGAYIVYGCLKYIPHRLAGASLVVPFVHYWWPCLPANLSRQALKRLPVENQRTFRIAYYFPWLLNLWMSQKWFPTLSIMSGNMDIFSPPDLEILKKLSESPSEGQEKILQQGIHESLYRDLKTGYAKWEFDPTDLINPFPDNEGSVHIWQGCEDRIIPSQINQFILEKLPWIQCHEVPDAGHFLIFERKFCEAIIRALLMNSVIHGVEFFKHFDIQLLPPNESYVVKELQHHMYTYVTSIYLRDGPAPKAAEKFTEYGPIREKDPEYTGSATLTRESFSSTGIPFIVPYD